MCIVAVRGHSKCVCEQWYALVLSTLIYVQRHVFHGEIAPVHQQLPHIKHRQKIVLYTIVNIIALPVLDARELA